MNAEVGRRTLNLNLSPAMSRFADEVACRGEGTEPGRGEGPGRGIYFRENFFLRDLGRRRLRAPLREKNDRFRAPLGDPS